MLINILCNVIAAIILFLIGIFWKDIISVRFSDLVYKGIKVNGTWKATENNTTAKGYKLSYPSVYTLNLEQSADRIKGVAIAEFVKEKREIVNYKVKGNIKDRFVFLSLTINEKNRISHSHFLLEVSGNGERMNGFMTFYALRSKEINAIEIYLENVGR